MVFKVIKELPTSIDQLTALQELYLFQCSKLKELPTFINQSMVSEKLHLFGCSKLNMPHTYIRHKISRNLRCLGF